MKVKVHSAINTIREADEDELLRRAMEDDILVTHFYDLLDKYKNVTLELEIKELDGVDIKKYAGAYVGWTLDALDPEFFDDEKIRLRDGTLLLFPLSVETPKGNTVMIYADDLPKYEKFHQSIKEKGVHEASFDVILSKLGVKRFKPAG